MDSRLSSRDWRSSTKKSRQNILVSHTPRALLSRQIRTSKLTDSLDDFEILGFPCNQFNSQDPGSNDEIQEFCKLNYGVSFPVLGKVDVNGDTADPVYQWLKKEKSGLLGLARIKWNFEKFLVGRDGKVINRWASTTKPEGLKKDIVAALSKTPAAKV